jgi:hypothetical protein
VRFALDLAGWIKKQRACGFRLRCPAKTPEFLQHKRHPSPREILRTLARPKGSRGSAARPTAAE